MIDLPVSVFIAVFITAWLCAMAWVIFFMRFSRRLNAHPDALKIIGKLPSPFRGLHSADDIKSTFRLITFLWQRQYTSLRHPEIINQADIGRKILVANIVSMTLLVLLIPFLILQESPASGDRQPTIEQSAVSLYEAGDYTNALAELNRGLAQTSDNANLLFYRALVYEQMAEFDLAYTDLEKVADLVPDHFDTYVHLDYLLARQQRWNEIISLWDRFLALQPEHGRAWLERGGARFRMGDVTNALNDALRSCELGYEPGCEQYNRLNDEQF